MGIPIASDPPARTSMPSKSETEVDFEQDAHLKKMLDRKNKLEEQEIYNSPETMQKKRKAVKEQARNAPKQRSPSTDLQFDDNIDTSPDASNAGAPKPKIKAKSKAESKESKTKTTSSHRTARRSRAAARRREAKEKMDGDAEAGQEHSPERIANASRRGRKRLRRLDAKQQSSQLEA